MGAETEYPRLRNERFFERLEAYMVVCDIEDDARHSSGQTWFLTTPDDMWPYVVIYFTYDSGRVVLQAAWANG